MTTSIIYSPSVSISPPRNNDIELFVSLDNLWDDNYEVCRTPGKEDRHPVVQLSSGSISDLNAHLVTVSLIWAFSFELLEAHLLGLIHS